MDRAVIEDIVGQLELEEGLIAAATDRLRRPPSDPLGAIVEPYRALVSAACASAHHEAEARVASALMEATEGLGAAGRAMAWQLVVDPLAEVLLAAELEAGLEPSGVAHDLARRKQGRNGPRPRSLTFATRHREWLASVSGRDGQEWFAERYRDRHGGSPPAGWWVDDPDAAMGGRIDPEFGHLFDARNHADFLHEMERRYRAERRLPALGEGWVSQRSLQACVEEVVPDADVIAEARLRWPARGSG